MKARAVYTTSLRGCASEVDIGKAAEAAAKAVAAEAALERTAGFERELANRWRAIRNALDSTCHPARNAEIAERASVEAAGPTLPLRPCHPEPGPACRPLRPCSEVLRMWWAPDRRKRASGAVAGCPDHRRGGSAPRPRRSSAHGYAHPLSLSPSPSETTATADGWARIPGRALRLVLDYLAATDPQALLMTVPVVCRSWSEGCRSHVVAHLDARWAARSLNEPRLTRLLGRFRAARALDLEQCGSVGDRGLKAIATQCPKLAQLSEIISS